MAFLAEVTTADIRVRNVSCSQDELSIGSMDGRTTTVPLVWYPRLARASADQLANRESAGSGHAIHWPEIDEDVSTERLLYGRPAPRRSERWSSSLARHTQEGAT